MVNRFRYLQLMKKSQFKNGPFQADNLKGLMTSLLKDMFTLLKLIPSLCYQVV